jgi:uncharacterized Zn-binding protein involved in type VI secretion
MGQPAAKEGDSITGMDVHWINVSNVPTTCVFDFNGLIDENLSPNVNIMKKRAAVIGSTAEKSSGHTPDPPPSPFIKTPINKAEIITGSSSVNINGKAAARNGDIANTCNDINGVPKDLPNGTVNASGTVMIG